MNDSVDVKRHINLRTIAKLKVHAELDMATLQQHISNTSTLVSGVGIPPSRHSICQSNMHLFSKSHNYYKTKNRIFVNINLYQILNNCEFASCSYGNKEK